MLFSWILLLVLYLPFQVALNPMAGIDLASIRVVILVIFLVWLGKGLKDKKIYIPLNFQTGGVITFLFFVSFSAFFARNVDWSIRKLAFIFSIFPIYFVVSEVVNDTEKLRKSIMGLVISGTLAASLGIAQFFAQFFIGVDALYRFWSSYVAIPFLGKTFSQAVLAHPSWLVDVSGHTYFRAISLFPDPHMFAFFLGLLLPLAMALFFKDRKTGWLFCAGIILLAELLTFSRGGYLGLVGGALALFFIFQSKVGNKYKIVIFLSIIAMVSILVVPSPISSRFFSSFNLEEGSNVGRLVMWSEAAKNILIHPFCGVGVGNFSLAVDPLATYREPIYAHNTYLDIAVEDGLPAALAWLGIIVFSLIVFFKKAKQEVLFFGAAISLIVFSIHSLTETGLYSPVVLTLFLMICAFSNNQEKNEKVS
ncbi:MAG: O-antigen ligase family protein [Parcubacteria group bacterium]